MKSSYTVLLERCLTKSVEVVAESTEEAERLALDLDSDPPTIWERLALEDEKGAYKNHATSSRVVCWTPFRE